MSGAAFCPSDTNDLILRRRRRDRWFMGEFLQFDPKPGFHLQWFSYTGETFLHADTLEGLKELVRESKKK